MVPPPLNAALMVACVSWHVALVVFANELVVVSFTFSGNVGA